MLLLSCNIVLIDGLRSYVDCNLEYTPKSLGESMLKSEPLSLLDYNILTYKQRIMKHKFRSECINDVVDLIHNIPNDEKFEICIKRDGIFSDVEVVIESDTLSSADILKYMEMVTDGHVMLETLDREDLYTGERTSS